MLVRIISLALGLSLVCCANHRYRAGDSPEVWKKIHVDFKRLDADGLAGPTGSKVAVNYEFCLPADEKYWRKVQKIDKTAQKFANAAGRAGCAADEWLVIGSTHQPQFRRVLYELAALAYIDHIEETFWE